VAGFRDWRVIHHFNASESDIGLFTHFHTRRICYLARILGRHVLMFWRRMYAEQMFTKFLRIGRSTGADDQSDIRFAITQDNQRRW